MKNPDYTTIKNINNLPKYEFGKMSSISATGYQPGNDVVNTGYIESTGANFDDMTSSQRTANTMQTVSTVGKAATNLYQTVSPSVGYLVGASGATKGTAATAGYVGGALSAVMGGLDIYGGANSIHNAMTDDELKTWSGSQVNYGYGNRAYTTHTFDAQGAKKLIDSRISGGKTQGVLGAAQTGSGVGSIVGTAIAPGLGTVIGTVGGGILGAIGGLIGFSGAGSNVNEKLDNLARAYDRNAVQARAVANTLGMQDEFNAKHGTTIGNSGLYHAKYGVKPGTSLKDTDKPQPVNTAYGVTYGRPNAVTNGKEGIYNPITGAYSRVEGDGKENKATAIDKSDAVINEKDRSAFEYAMSVGDYETMNNIMTNQGKKENKKLPSLKRGYKPQLFLPPDNYVSKYTPALSWENVTPLSTITDNVKIAPIDYNYEPLPLYDKKGRLFGSTNGEIGTKSDLTPGLINLGSYLANMGQIMYQNRLDKSQHISKYNPYVRSNAQNIFANVAKPYKDYSALASINDDALKSLYAIRNGAASAGQRMLMESSLMNNMVNTRANVHNAINANYYNQMNDYAKTLAGFADADNQRFIASNQYMDDTYNKKLSKRNDYLRANSASMAQTNSDFAKNYMNMYFGNRAYSKYDDRTWA